MTVYPSRVDAWLVPLLALPFAVGGIVIGVAPDLATRAIGIGVWVFYAIILGTLALPVRYTVAPEQLEIRAGMVRIRIPWERVIAMEPTRNPISSPALSLHRLEVRYTKPDGGERAIRISPRDRAAFVADCARTSGKHRADGERLARA